MSLETLALRVLLPSFPGPVLDREVAALLARGLGGVCLFGRNTTAGLDAVERYCAAVHDAAPDALVAIDEEGGDVTRLHVVVGSPVLGPAALGAADDLVLTHATGAAVGAELAALGIDLDLGPVADVNCEPDNPVIGSRSFGADPASVARHVAAWTTGLQSQGVAGCAKHFPGHGATREDSHLSLPALAVDRHTLETRELVPFRAAVAAGVGAVMTSHIVLPALDPDHPATLSGPVLRLLREDLAYDGAIVTDALDMAGVATGGGMPDAAVRALAAGADVLCLGSDTDVEVVQAVAAAVVAAVRTGRLSEQRLADAADRVGRIRRTPTSGPVPSPDSLAGARSATAVEGSLPELRGARVVSLDTPATIAVGDGPWGLVPDHVVPPGRPLPEHRPLIVQVRDAHRRPEVHDTLRELDRAVVVEWGWPGPRVGSAPRITTRGCSRPGVVVVTELLRAAGWDR